MVLIMRIIMNHLLCMFKNLHSCLIPFLNKDMKFELHVEIK